MVEPGSRGLLPAPNRGAAAGTEPGCCRGRTGGLPVDASRQSVIQALSCCELATAAATKRIPSSPVWASGKG